MSGIKIIEGLKQAIADDFGRITIEGQTWVRMPNDSPDLLKELATHFVVKDGPLKEQSQYGHLELWWAGKSVDEPADALINPWMMLASAQGSYSLACMSQLQRIISEARERALAS